MRLDIRPSNEELKKALNSISVFNPKARMRIENAVEVTVKEMARLAKSKVPRKSGALRKSIFFSFRKAGPSGVFGAKEHHAHLIELGVDQSEVRPKNARNKKGRPSALKIASAGGDRYMARATIPKRAPRPFIRPAYEEERPNFIRRLEKAVKDK